METALIKSENIQSISALLPSAYSENQASVKKCVEFGNTLLSKVATTGMNDALDEEIALYIKKNAATYKKISEKRAPITKLFDEIRSVFTEMEKEIDTKNITSPVCKLQQYRNEYARKKLEEEKKRKEAELKKQQVETAKGTYKATVENELFEFFNSYVTGEINKLLSLNNSVTFENYEQVYAKIKSFPVEYESLRLTSFVSGAFIPVALDINTCLAIQKEVISSKTDAYSKQFNFDISAQKDSLLQLLPSKRNELLSIEEMRKSSIEEAAKRELELKQKEKEEATRLEMERTVQATQEKSNINLNQQQANIGALFAGASAAVHSPVKAKTKKVINVTDARGFLEILNLWWLNEGCGLSVDELAKKFKSQITFCEKLANEKDPQLINSQFIVYEEEVKAK